jgi:hypothetical protein
MDRKEAMLKQLREWSACTDGYEWAESNCDSLSDAWQKCERGDWLLWLLEKAGYADKSKLITILCNCAERVLPVFEAKYPDDQRPRQAIEAARVAAENDKPENRAAAWAVWAAAGDAWTAAEAAWTAWDAAEDAGAAARDAEAAERKWQADMIRQMIDNPFTEV